jgi:hypothetical protein
MEARRPMVWSPRTGRPARQARRIAEFASKRLAQSVDNLIRIDASASADHIDQRVTVDQRTREGADVGP